MATDGDMFTDFDADLARLLDQFDEKRNAVAARMRQVKADEVAFLQDFAELRRSVVRPVFEAVGAALKLRGHDFRIVEDEYALEQGGKTTEARISIRILPAAPDGTSPGPEQCPSIAFATRHYTGWSRSTADWSLPGRADLPVRAGSTSSRRSPRSSCGTSS